MAILAGSGTDAAALGAILEREPDLCTQTPAVDAQRVDLGALKDAMEEFWASYFELPLPPGCDSSRETYRHLPEPLPHQHRAMLDQCRRVLFARHGWVGSSEHGRLYGLVLGYTAPVPGTEDLAAHYRALALAHLETLPRGRR